MLSGDCSFFTAVKCRSESKIMHLTLTIQSTNVYPLTTVQVADMLQKAANDIRAMVNPSTAQSTTKDGTGAVVFEWVLKNP
jgi:hypothetical protein